MHERAGRTDRLLLAATGDFAQEGVLGLGLGGLGVVGGGGLGGGSGERRGEKR